MGERKNMFTLDSHLHELTTGKYTRKITLHRGQWGNPVKEWILNICLVISIPLNPLRSPLVIHWLTMGSHFRGPGFNPWSGNKIPHERKKVKSLSCIPLFAIPWTVACQVHLWDFLGKNTGVCCHFLLQRIFLIQGSNPCLLHCRQILYHLSHFKEPRSHMLQLKILCSATKSWQSQTNRYF